MANQTFTPGIGRLTTDRYSFKNHVEGTDFRHDATQIDIDDPTDVYGNPNNVENALANITSYIEAQIGAGQGFITVGDGYNTWHNADGNINFDPSVPALNILLNPIFTAIYNNTALPAGYERIRHGGIIVIKAGTYIVDATINVPPGITLLGEGYGTKICNVTSLTIPVNSGIAPQPKVSPTPSPVFKVLSDSQRSLNDSAVDPNLFVFSRTTKFVNMVICDNFVENTILGDVYYKLPQNSTGSNPLILQQTGSDLELDNVYMLGRVTFGVGTAVIAATRFAVQLDVSNSVTTGTYLRVNNCFMDGFSVPIQFASIGGVVDYLQVTNSYIRAHGYLDGANLSHPANCIIHMNDNNARVTNNDFYGNHFEFRTALYIGAKLVGISDINDRSKIILASNNMIVDRGSNTAVSSGFIPYAVNASIASTLSNNVYIMCHSNNYQSKFDVSFTVDSGGSPLNVLTANSTSLQTGGGFYNNTVTVSTSPRTLQATDHVLLVITASSAITINLAASDAGRMIIIKDVSGNASVNNITIAPQGGAGIEGIGANYIVNGDFQTVKLVSSGSDWWII